MRLIFIPVLITTVVLTGCSFPGVHKNPVKQGNQLIPERVQRLEVGMSRDQVQFLLGSPITVNTFNPNRWIYLERIDFDGEVQQNTYLIVTKNIFLKLPGVGIHLQVTLKVKLKKLITTIPP